MTIREAQAREMTIGERIARLNEIPMERLRDMRSIWGDAASFPFPDEGHAVPVHQRSARQQVLVCRHCLIRRIVKREDAVVYVRFHEYDLVHLERCSVSVIEVDHDFLLLLHVPYLPLYFFHVWYSAHASGLWINPGVRQFCSSASL